MTWIALKTGDCIADHYDADGTRSVEITIFDSGGDPTVYTSDNPTIADGAMRAKLAKTGGGAAVAVSFDVDGAVINALKYEVTV